VTGYAQVWHRRPVEGAVWDAGRRRVLAGRRPVFHEGPVVRRGGARPAGNAGAAAWRTDAVPKTRWRFDPATGRPRTWPMRLGKGPLGGAAAGLPAGEHVLRSRAVDEKGIAQPMPRPFRKSGYCEIEEVKIQQ